MEQKNDVSGLKNDSRQRIQHGSEKWGLKNNETPKPDSNEEKAELESAVSNRVGETAPRGPREGGNSWTMSGKRS